jgi:hypothetical protein
MIHHGQYAAAGKANLVLVRLSGAKSRVELHLQRQMAPSVSTDCNAVLL